ncbi:hypothetical protein LFYK43_12060 [Ligilactobacillus salitolerans]|uniref:Uncharacterized protein n=1 Tax=Ligilactobacillus salitolerans TaxID=1808352 RepID=A0A401ITB7_9LACO|nr:hypothetical protein [Ligilactobacillus salitolerans]GBG94747.1 hypothetical protein LFYK43_12060 [Ligilactobacillus salitolerans]
MSELQIQTIINGREYQTEELDELYLVFGERPSTLVGGWIAVVCLHANFTKNS